jgi:putative two-component system response regulator
MPKRAIQPIPGEQATVVVVDDDRWLCELVAVWLHAQGHDCLIATTAAEGREALRDPRVSICICDVDLGPHSGLELAEDVGILAPEVALVMMSGSDDITAVEQSLRLGAYDYLLKPFRESELAIAVRNAFHRRRLELDSRDLHRRLEEAVETRTLELALSREETIQRLARAIEFRDSTTGQHVERMSELCRMLAGRVGLAAQRAALIRTASLLHDIGKLGIPDRILAKPDSLEGDEWEEMKTHTTLGHRLLSGSHSELVELAATIALTHHERVDGTGYPSGLSGAEIPIEGRIAAVCDVFDALTSPRPYRERAFTVDEAAAVMRAERGGAFDAPILDIFLSSLDEVERISARYAQNGNLVTAA